MKELTVRQLVTCGALDRPLDGNHGAIHPKESDFCPSGVPFIMASDLKDGRLDVVNCKFIPEHLANRLRKGFARRGDILISHKGTIGRTAYIGSMPYDRVVLTPQITYYRVLDHQRINPCIFGITLIA